jgi:hypothetical protein
MQLPPHQKNEPEWLQVQRVRRREENNWNLGGLSAIALAAVPYAIWETMRAPPFVALLIAVGITILAIMVTRRSVKGSFQRGFAVWSMAVHGPSAVAFLAMTARQL